MGFWRTAYNETGEIPLDLPLRKGEAPPVEISYSLLHNKEGQPRFGAGDYMGPENTASIMNVDHAVECTILERVNRFVVAVDIAGKRCRASINNTGRLEQFLVPGRKGFCLRPERQGKTDCRLFAVEEPPLAAVIDTQLQMKAFERGLEQGAIPWLAGHALKRRTARLGESLIDYLLDHEGKPAYLEVKSAVLRDVAYAMYPDCPTSRGRKHVRELTALARSGGNAAILFIAALPGVSAFKPYRAGDPEMYRLLVEAGRSGVALKAISMAYRPRGSSVCLLNADLPVEIA